jgi:hypothetical protein
MGGKKKQKEQRSRGREKAEREPGPNKNKKKVKCVDDPKSRKGRRERREDDNPIVTATLA